MKAGREPIPVATQEGGGGDEDVADPEAGDEDVADLEGGREVGRHLQRSRGLSRLRQPE